MRVTPTSLASRILVAVLAILAVTMTTGLLLYLSVARATADRDAQERASSIAAATGDRPDVVAALRQGDPEGRLRSIAAEVARATGAAYVVVIGANGLRYSHPNPALIGKRIQEPVVALDGTVHTGLDDGSLGRSANARAPVAAPGAAPVGEVSVGILETTVSDQTNRIVGAVLLYSGLAAGVGLAASLLLARTLKRVTFGLEPAEIAGLVQEREAMLHGIREGVIAFDTRGRLNVLNDEARRLLGLHSAQPGQPLEDVLPSGRLRDILSGATSGNDQVALTDEHLLVLNRMPVAVAGRSAGSVTTIRDRTELEALLRQLDSVEGLTSALRAQEHEFSNRLHALSVLLELGEIDEATAYAGELRVESVLVADDVRTRVGPPVVAALLLAKIAVAAERNVELVLEPGSRLTCTSTGQAALLTILGNLVDNAVDAVADSRAVSATGARGRVTVRFREEDGLLHLAVADTGPGIPPEQLEQVFLDGYSTKIPRAGLRRGVGLALVHRLVRRAGGSITVENLGGARFEVVLPMVREDTYA